MINWYKSRPPPNLNAKAFIGICIIILKLLEKSSMEILGIKSINKDSPSGWGGQKLAKTYNKLSISFNNWGYMNAQNREILSKN